jgi:hypothetical protein
MAVSRKDIVNPPSPEVSKNSVLAISEGQTRINLAIVQSQKGNQTRDEVQRIINSIIASIVLDIKDTATRILVRRSLVEYAQVQYYTWLNNSDGINKRLFNELLKRKDTLEFDTNGAIKYIGNSNSFVINRQNKTYRLKATIDNLKTNRQGDFTDEFIRPIDVLTDDRFRNVITDIKNIVPVIQDYQKLVNEQIKAFATNPPKVTYTSAGVVRKMNIRAYAEMKVRYEANQKDLEKYTKEAQLGLRPGINVDEADLVWTSSHANCSKRCEVWQGKLYSVTGRTGKNNEGFNFTSLNEALEGINKDGNGIINGYNCRHFLIGYKRGSKPPVTYSADEIKKQRAIDQSQRSRENTIRNLKSRARVLAQLGQNDKAKALLNKANSLTAKYRIFSLDNKRAYLQWRTQILPNENELNLIQNGLQVVPLTATNIAPTPVAPPPPVKTERDLTIEQTFNSQPINAIRNSILNNTIYNKDIPPSQEVTLFNQDIQKVLNNSNDEILKVLNLFLVNQGTRSGVVINSVIRNDKVSHYDPTDNKIRLNFKEHTSRSNGYYQEGVGINDSPLSIVFFHELGHKIDNEIGKAIPFGRRSTNNWYITSLYVKNRNTVERNTGENVIQSDITKFLLKNASFTNTNTSKITTLEQVLKKDKQGNTILKFASAKRLIDTHSSYDRTRFIRFGKDNYDDTDSEKYNLELIKKLGFNDELYTSLQSNQEKNDLLENWNGLLDNSRSIFIKGINQNYSKDIQDIIGGVVGTRVGWGHSTAYMNRTSIGKDPTKITEPSSSPFGNPDEKVTIKNSDLEVTAEFFEATVTGGTRLEAIKQYFPQTYKLWYEAFKETVELAIKGQEIAKSRQNDPTFKADAKYQNW